MCVSLLGRVVDVEPDGLTALVDGDAGTVRVGLLAIDGVVVPGDWVLLNAGLAVARLDGDDVAAVRALQREANEGDDHAR
jgi:hydrogenase maturation factor